MSKRRMDTVFPTEVQVFHVFNRCVRRTFLCGFDSVSGQDYSHRKEWLRERLEFLVGVFAFDVATFCILSNHFHLVLRSRPDIVASWSDREVIRRNLRLQGSRWFRKDGAERKTTQAEIERLEADSKEVARIRMKLSNLSDLMAYFDEYSAKRANREDEVRGAFWEGTFGSVVLEDEEAILACMAYVDLNPIRAQVAKTLEESEYTGAFERLIDLRIQQAELHASCSPIASNVALRNQQMDKRSNATFKEAVTKAGRFAFCSEQSTLDLERRGLPISGWLAPIELSSNGDFLDLELSERRPSRKGFLPITLLKYLEIVDWAATGMHPAKKGKTPTGTPPIFERLGFCSQRFLAEIQQLKKYDYYFKSTERCGIPENPFDALSSSFV